VPIVSKLRDIFWSRRSAPLLAENEQVLREGVAILTRGIIGARTAKILLTNQRLIYYEEAVGRPFKPTCETLTLSSIKSVDKGTLFDFIGGGRRLRMRLRSGKDRMVWVGELDEWIAALNEAIVSLKASA
jgi:hypothetical protein